MSHTRKTSSRSSTLDSIAECPKSQNIQHEGTFLYSPSARSPNTPKWNRYKTYYYNSTPIVEKCPSILSLPLLGAESDDESEVSMQKVLHNTERCPSILSLPLLSAESDDEDNCEDWNQGWDKINVQKMPFVVNTPKLPLITEGEFNYYPEQSAEIVSSWSDSSDGSDSGEDEREYVAILNPRQSVKVRQSLKVPEKKMVQRTYEKKRFGSWLTKILRKLKGRK